jgi:cell division protein FtsL
MKMVGYSINRLELAITIILVMILVASALAVVYNKNRSRSIFIEIERQQRLMDQYEVEWGQMQLELSTLAEQNRVEMLAKEKLKLVLPSSEQIIYIKP